MTKLRLKTMAQLFVVSIVVLTGSPALATQTARHNVHCHSCEKRAGAYRHQTFGPGVVRQSAAPRWNGGNTTHDDWPAGMILGLKERRHVPHLRGDVGWAASCIKETAAFFDQAHKREAPRFFNLIPV